MFRLDNYMEEWATKCKRMLHSPMEPHFFRCNSEFTIDQFLQQYQDATYPVCGIVTHLEGIRNVERNIDSPLYKPLFAAYADADDYQAQADAKAINKENADLFLAKLYHDKKKAEQTDRTSPLALLDLTSVRYDTIGPMTSKGWFVLVLTIESKEYNRICYTPSDYLE